MAQADVPYLVIESQDAEIEAELRALLDSSPELISIVETKSFSATHYALQAIVPLVPTAASIVALVATWIRAKRHVEVSVGGVTLKGMSPGDAERLLTTIVELGDVESALARLDEAKSAQHQSAPRPD